MSSVNRMAVFFGFLMVGLGVWLSVGWNTASLASEGRAPALVIYSGPNFTGESRLITASTVDLPKDGTPGQFKWNDSVRSLKVISGTWRLYQNGRFNTVLDQTPAVALDVAAKPLAKGWSCLVSASSQGPLEFSRSEQGDWSDDVSSIELVSEHNLPDWAMQ